MMFTACMKVSGEFEAIWWDTFFNPSLIASNSPKIYLHTTSVLDCGATGELLGRIAPIKTKW